MTDIPTALEDAQAHLAAALLQTVPSDDEIIMGHVRDAHAIIRDVRRQLASPPRFVPGSKGPHPRPSYHRQAEELRCEDVLPDVCRCVNPWSNPTSENCSECGGHISRILPLATCAALNGDDTPPDQAA